MTELKFEDLEKGDLVQIEAVKGKVHVGYVVNIKKEKTWYRRHPYLELGEIIDWSTGSYFQERKIVSIKKLVPKEEQEEKYK